jgi:telomerase reverse transcriptase
MLHEFIYYIFDSLLIPLIRSNFYVTESQAHRNRLFYFRHDVWHRLTEKPFADIKSSMFEEIKRDKAQRILARRSLGYSALRLLPKAAGARPIVNLRRRMVKNTVFQNGKKKTFLGPSINSLVTPIFSALSYEKTRKADLLGSAMFSVDDMYPRLKAFKEKLTHRAGTGQPAHLFFAKLDIQSCFDTIPQNKLLAVIGRLMSEEALYHVTKHVEVRPAERYNSRLWREDPGRQKFIRKFVSKAVSASEIGSAPIPGIANKKRNTVFVDTPVVKNHDTDNLLYLLDEHVRNNLVKIGKKYFRQRNGIPQGSVLSSLLCNFFYGELEREVLGFLHCEDALLLRLIDDFLLITSRADLAQRFLQVMMDGEPDYGISVNPSKSLVNFEATINGTKMPRQEGSSFPYCGCLIDTHTLDLRKDRDYGGATQVSDSLTVELNRVPGQTFHRKVLASFKLQTHARFLDTEHNASKVVLSGIYTNFVETAIKMYRYFKSLRPRTRPSPDLVTRTIRDLMQFATNIIQSKRRQTTKPKDGETPPGTSTRIDCAITRLQIQHLGAAAFCHVLSRKQTQFSSVLRFLEQLQRATRPETDRDALQMKRVIREGNAVFDGWRY